MRAALVARLHAFFAGRGVLGVETPLLAAAGSTELHLASLVVRADAIPRPLYLQTSPEYHMKRLLAAGSGAIYQLGRAFRDGERGRRHNLELTLLEWYRPGWDHHALMDEMDELLAALLGPLEDATRAPGPARRVTYDDLFRRHAGVDPHRASAADLDHALAAHGVAAPAFDPADRDGRLDLLLTHVVEPRLGAGAVFVHDYPASQASLARLRPADGDAPAVAERFEVYLDGVELANGFHELTDAAEQRRRFVADLAARRAAGLPAVPVDERLLAALEHGLPSCAGVALGFDRLVMHAAGAEHIDDVVAFPVERA